MIPKSGCRFSERSCSTDKLERDDDSNKSHRALGAAFDASRPSIGSFRPQLRQRARPVLEMVGLHDLSAFDGMDVDRHDLERLARWLDPEERPGRRTFGTAANNDTVA